MAHLYKWREDTIFQGIRDKSEVIWRTCWGKQLGNILRTHWELEGNIVWTHWESGKYEKSFPPPHPQNIKGKKQGTLSACLGLPIDCMKFLFPKDLGHHFWPGPTPLAKNTLPIQCWGTFDWKNINCPIFQKHFRSRELPVLDISKP